MISTLITWLKKIPIDLGQESVADYTEGKQIAMNLVPDASASNEQTKHALDVGARHGVQTRWLQSKGYAVTSIDMESQFDACMQVDANQPLPFDDDAFDLIWCSEVLEHLENPGNFIAELRRVTKLGGDIILTTPNSYAWFFRLFALFGLPPERLQRDDHIHFFCLDDIRHLANDANIYGYFPYMIIKRTIAKGLSLLTPTFIIHIRHV